MALWYAAGIPETRGKINLPNAYTVPLKDVLTETIALLKGEIIFSGEMKARRAKRVERPS